jgi:hypothetical protein
VITSPHLRDYVRHSGAHDSTTVDWSGWMTLTPAQQAATWARYRQIVRAESEQARMTFYARMDRALYQGRRT